MKSKPKTAIKKRPAPYSLPKDHLTYRDYFSYQDLARLIPGCHHALVKEERLF